MGKLFEPSEINGMILANRFFRSATWAGMATDEGVCTSQLIDLVAGLADGGVGMIITGHAYVHRYGQHQPWQLGIYSDDLIPALQDMTGAVHDRGGKIVLQLGYGGAYLSKSRVRMMTGKDIREVVDAFGQAALRAKKAGFDGVQIFAAHGFFLSQLLCPRYNDRTDEYGGNIRNRARALLEVLQAVRKAAGREYQVLAKLNCQDFVENGLILEDSIRVGVMLEEGGIDAIELSGGLLNIASLLENKFDSETDEAPFQDAARAFKEKIQVALILVGGIRSYSVVERLVEEGTADYISMCRPFIREPDLVNRWKAGDLRKATCISCNHCVQIVQHGKGVSCVPLEEEVQTFFPQLSEMIPASPPHPPGTCYKVSIGLEELNANYIPVVKVQMVYNDHVSEKKNPSYPLGTDDHIRVNRAIKTLLEQQGRDSSET
jgi:2,4-dienoyl-CoA reductase-like NADH-dependent reductase (Old Yellow Enzyme family)